MNKAMLGYYTSLATAMYLMGTLAAFFIGDLSLGLIGLVAWYGILVYMIALGLRFFCILTILAWKAASKRG